MTGETGADERNRRALDRVIMFSDGVFAIAITLLALDLRLPPLAERSSAALLQALAANAPRFLSFVVSFGVTGIFWLAHQRMFSLIARFDRGLALVNLLFLMSIAVMPFSMMLIGEYGELKAATAFYSGSLVFTSVTSNLLWMYAARGRRLLDPQVSRADVRVTTARGVVTLVMFVVSFGVAFVSVTAARITWVLTVVAARLAGRLARRR
jgi:uncharacterized membrane protein